MKAIEKGDRFEALRPRDEGKVIEVREVLDGGTRFRVQTEVHPKNPTAVGLRRTVSLLTLQAEYRRISR